MDSSGFDAKPVCRSDALINGGAGVRFSVRAGGVVAPAFVIRHADAVYGYINRCTHRQVELDWEEGKFFDLSGRWLMCSTHGALYDPRDGACVGGPCQRGLTGLPVFERDGHVWLQTSDDLDLAEVSLK